ncbi:MAG: hypothetical protein GX575_26205 [Candidatus Anammoximicrobium sp.]|nr:hypothetical protein [Candidatus Anammoximicrobium sp.]
MCQRISTGRVLGLLIGLAMWPGCGQPPPPATVEGTLRMAGKTLDNCLVQFLPNPAAGQTGATASAVTDGAGHFELRLPDQRVGASVGRQCVVVQDLSVSTGRPRIDNGTIDMEQPPKPTPPRRSRVAASYASAALTPLQVELRPGHQVIELEVLP